LTGRCRRKKIRRTAEPDARPRLGVVAMLRMIQRDSHEIGEGNRTASRRDGGPNFLFNVRSHQIGKGMDRTKRAVLGAKRGSGIFPFGMRISCWKPLRLFVMLAPCKPTEDIRFR